MDMRISERFGFISGQSQTISRKFLSHVKPTGVERFFEEEEIIVSKTDVKGRIIYANDVFLRVAGITEAQALGAAHSVIRHPDMPRAVFKFLWDTIATGQEIFAYVVNMAANGDHYWVFAHVTPSFDEAGKIIGYHSNRRLPDPAAVAKVKPLYAQLCEIERNASDRTSGMEAAIAALLELLKTENVSYDEFVFSL